MSFKFLANKREKPSLRAGGSVYISPLAVLTCRWMQLMKSLWRGRKWGPILIDGRGGASCQSREWLPGPLADSGSLSGWFAVWWAGLALLCKLAHAGAAVRLSHDESLKGKSARSHGGTPEPRRRGRGQTAVTPGSAGDKLVIQDAKIDHKRLLKIDTTCRFSNIIIDSLSWWNRKTIKSLFYCEVVVALTVSG